MCTKTGTCLSKDKVCNNENDCGDGDESEEDPDFCCTYPGTQYNFEEKCAECDPASQFKCETGQCIPKSEHCDGTPNCGDESDENLDLAGCCDPTRRNEFYTAANCPCGDDEIKCSNTNICISTEL